VSLLFRSMIKWSMIVVALIIGGLFSGILLIVYFEYGEDHWVPSIRLIGTAAFTVLVFGALVTEYSRSWRSPRFWLWISLLLTLHVLGYALLFRVVEHWRAIWYALITTVEIPLLMTLLHSQGFPYAPLSLTRRRKI
jgi:hypothetical protein